MYRRQTIEQIEIDERGKASRSTPRHHLDIWSLTAEDLEGLDIDFGGATLVCSTPPRDRASQEAMCGPD